MRPTCPIEGFFEQSACFHILVARSKKIEENKIFLDFAMLGFHIHHHHHHHHHHHLHRGIWLQQFCYKHFDGYPLVAGFVITPLLRGN